MVVDFRQRLSTTKVRFFRDSPHESTVRWYRAQAGAQALPLPHRFGSLQDWGAGPDPPDEPGEVPFSFGAARDLTSPFPGTGFIGEADWWLNGLPVILTEGLMTLLNVRHLTGTGTFVPSPGATVLVVELLGGGGGGGQAIDGGGGFGAAGAGGAAGGFTQSLLSPVLADYAFACGAAGAGGTVLGVAATAGGTTSFGATLTALGGTGGGTIQGAGGPQSVFGALPGAGGVGDLPARGQPGGAGWTDGVGMAVGGQGGGSPWGSGGRQRPGSSGGAGLGWGAGGAGASVFPAAGGAEAGGAGTPGRIRVWEFS